MVLQKFARGAQRGDQEIETGRSRHHRCVARASANTTGSFRKDWKASQAAGVIHTDFDKGFIKAWAISVEDLVATGSVHEVRAKCKDRLEGEDYFIRDGDMVEFRHS